MYTLNKKILMSGMGTLLSIALASSAYAEQTQSVEAYKPVANVMNTQAQVVYYRSGNTLSNAKSAEIYVDGEFHTALPASTYTAFCVKPGDHTLGAYIGDEPIYKGKKTNLHSISLLAGKTYYVAVDESNANPLDVKEEKSAASALMGTHAQEVFLSRASSVTSCKYLYDDVTLSGDVLFNFGKYSEKDIKSEGRVAINQVASKAAVGDRKVTVIGHTDPIGKESSNLALGLKRAQTVRNMLIEGGMKPENITASSTGSKEPVAYNCEKLSRSAKISCYAPDRRVVVRMFNN